MSASSHFSGTNSHVRSIRVNLIFPAFSCVLSLSIKEMEAEVNRVLRGGSPHEVLSEGFGLSLTRKDLHTLSNLNWLNDEVNPQAKICVHQMDTHLLVMPI